MNVNSSNKNRYWIPIILILMYFYIGELKNVIYFNSLIWLGSLAISIALLMHINGKLLIISKENIVWILVWLFFIVFRNQNIKSGIDYNILYYIFMIISMILLKKSVDWIECMIKFLSIICLVHAVITIISSFIPTFYFNYIIPIIGQEYRNDVTYLYYQGCMSGLTSHYSINGMYLAIGTGFISTRSLYDENMKKWKRIIFPSVMVIALLLTGKRAHSVFVGIAIAIVYLIYNYKKIGTGLMKLLAVAILLICIYLVVSLFVPSILVVYERLFNSDYSTLGGRTELYSEAIKLFKTSPIMGHGWGAYRNYIQYTVGLNYSSKYAKMNAHNIYLQLLSETGVLGFSFFIGLMIYNLKKAIRTLKYLVKLQMNNKSLLVNVSILLFIQLFFILYGFTGNPLYDALMYIIYLFSCAGVSSVIYKLKNI